jgi:hypothetical protein
MRRFTLILAATLLAAAPAVVSPGFAEEKAAPKKSAQVVKAGKGEKVCRVKMQYTGEVKTWTCKVEEPCCVWHEINYVKCGSTITGCL